MAKLGATATTVDFVTMYPAFDQKLLKERLQDAIAEAWQWEEETEEGKHLRIAKSGWVWLTDEEVTLPTLGMWCKAELLELLEFVIDNGYIQRRNLVLKQVRGFGMGLACAPQIANLGCYPVESLWTRTLISCTK